MGNPAAGIQEVWVTYTALNGPFAGKWQSVDLTQSTTNSTLWQATLALDGTAPGDVRYIVQAVNGVGLVSLNTNLGAYYIPGVDTEPNQPTTLAFVNPPATGVYGSKVAFAVVLKSGVTGLPGKRIIFRLGAQSRQAFTDSTGHATATLALLGVPGDYEARASFGGDSTYIASRSDTSPFTITKRGTVLTLDPPSAVRHPGDALEIKAILAEGTTGRPLGEKTVFFILKKNGVIAHAEAVITDYAGRAPLSEASLAVGTYAVEAYFSGNIPLTELLQLDDERYISSSIVTGTLTINNPPVAVGDSYAVDEDTTLTVAAPGVLGNDEDADGNGLTAALVGGPTYGSLTLNADGSFSYTPNADFNGSDSFTYKANDGFEDSNTATVAITVNPVNDAPVAGDDSTITDEDTAKTITVLANDTDVDGDTLTITSVTQGVHGAVTTDGMTVTYTPTADFCGSDTFTYTVSDGQGGTDMATVDVTVTCVNDAPVANDDAATTTENTAVVVAVLANDTDVDGDALTVASVTQGTNGSVTTDGTTVTYTPNAGFTGTDTFAYTVGDGNGGTDTATVTITVNPANTLPDCSAATTDEVSIWSPDKTFRPVHVIGVTDPDGDPVTIIITSLFQDESTGNNWPDGRGIGTDTAELRAERDGNGDGRVYHIFFDASDGRGGLCSGEVKIGVVPHDQGSGINAIDQGALYNSTEPPN
ncbi:MAG: hypothetical protein A2W37_13100 [Chloroflexi bacterium RBG_16_63_12]|nr:MAG: hypothetical protein A2W37_13100 [Chloroflexi bacterium RBG_16_63_12]